MFHVENNNLILIVIDVLMYGALLGFVAWRGHPDVCRPQGPHAIHTALSGFIALNHGYIF